MNTEEQFAQPEEQELYSAMDFVDETLNDFVTTAPSDCLVLKIQENYDTNNRLDQSVFILYDQSEHRYVIRGKRYSKIFKSKSFNFYADCKSDVIDFLTTIICNSSYWTYELYNCKNLPLTSDNITYKFLENNCNKENEISAYDSLKYRRHELSRWLRLLKYVYNEYICEL
jgi:hypothetical protein